MILVLQVSSAPHADINTTACLLQIVLEYSPGAWEVNQKWEEYPMIAGMLDLCALILRMSAGSLSLLASHACASCATWPSHHAHAYVLYGRVRWPSWHDYDPGCGCCSLVQKGYTVLHVDDVYSRAYVTPEKWTEPPPAFREVTADNLKYDLEDALKMQKRIMGCHNPQELVAQYRRVSRRRPTEISALHIMVTLAHMPVHHAATAHALVHVSRVPVPTRS